MSDPNVIEQPEARPVVACSDLLEVEDWDNKYSHAYRKHEDVALCGKKAEGPERYPLPPKELCPICNAIMNNLHL